MHPLVPVAVTATTEIIRGALRLRVNVAYTQALRGAGLLPLVLPVLAPEDADAALDGVAALVQAARARGLPTLAICRGVQILNVALGGTLVQDIATEWSNPIVHDGDWARK